jgi:hypothetical protein
MFGPPGGPYLTPCHPEEGSDEEPAFAPFDPAANLTNPEKDLQFSHKQNGRPHPDGRFSLRMCGLLPPCVARTLWYALA